MSLTKIRLEIARDAEFPEGSSRHGYEFVAPLDGRGHIDPEVWHRQRSRCWVKRFWNGEPDETGHVLRRPGGSWVFHYDIQGDPDDDESGYRFDDHHFVPGEYVSIREHGEAMKTFKVVSVVPTP